MAFRNYPWCCDDCRKQYDAKKEEADAALEEARAELKRIKMLATVQRRERRWCTCGHPGAGCYCR